LIEKVLKFIDEYKLSGKTIIVGFSGGYDSMCLMDIMRKIAPDKDIRLVAAHYNHNWRGDCAKYEQQKCKEYCLKNKIEFYTETAPADVKKTETQARELRYNFFNRAIEKYSADALFTAHNYDDNAETILYRIIKGTGVNGLQGILPKRGKYYRPILNIKRSEIEKYCLENGLSPNDDSSNEDRKYKRNLIRHEIIPLLEKINPEIKSALNNLAKVSTSEMNIVNEYLAAIPDLYNRGKINTPRYKSLSADVKKKVLYQFIYQSKFDYDYTLIENLYTFIQECIKDKKISKFSVSKTDFVYIDSKHIEIISTVKKDNTVHKIDRTGTYKIGGSVFRIEKCLKKRQFVNEKTAFADLSKIKNPVLRTRRDGDIIRPLGFDGTVKLKKYLIDKKIPQYMRDKLLLLCEEKEVLWVAGVGLSDKIKVTDKPTHMLSIEYNEEIL